MTSTPLRPHRRYTAEARTDGRPPWVPPRRRPRADPPRHYGPGRHRLHDDPAMPRRDEARHEATAAMTPVDRQTDGLPGATVPFPEHAGQLIQHPVTGAVAVAANATHAEQPRADRFPCYAVLTGHRQHGGHAWLTYPEVIAGGWVLAGNVFEHLTTD